MRFACVSHSRVVIHNGELKDDDLKCLISFSDTVVITFDDTYNDLYLSCWRYCLIVGDDMYAKSELLPVIAGKVCATMAWKDQNVLSIVNRVPNINPTREPVYCNKSRMNIIGTELIHHDKLRVIFGDKYYVKPGTCVVCCADGSPLYPHQYDHTQVEIRDINIPAQCLCIAMHVSRHTVTMLFEDNSVIMVTRDKDCDLPATVSIISPFPHAVRGVGSITSTGHDNVAHENLIIVAGNEYIKINVSNMEVVQRIDGVVDISTVAMVKQRSMTKSAK